MEKKIKLKSASVSAYSERVILQILFKHGGWAHFCSDRFVIRAADLALALGLPSDLKLEEVGTLKAVRAALQARYQELKRLAQPDEERMQLEKNLLAVAATLHLSEVELSILRLAAYMQIEQPLKEALNLVGNQIDRRRFCNLLSGLVQQPFDAIREALGEQEKLMRFGLLNRNRHSRDFDDHLQWGEALDVDKLDVHAFSEDALLKRVLTATAPSSLNWQDFEHIAPMANRARDYLNVAYQTRRKGVNVLLYGAPGTGKTEFASLLAQQLNAACYTLSSMDEDEDLLSGKRKLKSAQLAQALLLGQRALLVFDEVEDVFAGDLFRRSVAQEHKAWMNQFLESNEVPMVWISNDVHCMDDAFIRRFDLVIEMPDIPYQNKLSLIKKLSEQKLAQHELSYLAKQQGITPAMLARSFQVASSLEKSEMSFGEHLFGLLNQTLRAQGKKKLHRPCVLYSQYSLDYVTCEENLEKISRGLKNNPHARICCYGPPGTGKTAWANWLGEQLGMPVLLKQGSDLLGMYVGETEKNIASAFEQATEQNMLLVLDEIDSFLFSRDGAERSWERSMVNEMLTQIERFDGVMVVSTNLMHQLDYAALRRFDVKIRFSYLKGAQLLALARQQVALLGLPDLSNKQEDRLKQLHQLAPGDFAAVARRHRFAVFEHVDAWIDALEQECDLKPQETRRMGFM